MPMSILRVVSSDDEDFTYSLGAHITMHVRIPAWKRPFARRIAVAPLGRRSLSYDATIGNLNINKETRVIFQGTPL